MRVLSLFASKKDKEPRSMLFLQNAFAVYQLFLKFNDIMRRCSNLDATQ